MESSVNCDVFDISEKSRSLDLNTIYDAKSEVDDGGGLKRKCQLSEFGFGQSYKKKKSVKEVSLSSFESVNNKSRNIYLNAVDGSEFVQRNANEQVSGEGLNEISASLDGECVPVLKRPQCFTRRKKVQNNQVEDSADGGLPVKLYTQPVTECNLKVNSGYIKEKNSSIDDSAKESVSLKEEEITSGMVWTDVDKKQDGLMSSVTEIADPLQDLREDDEENLEENAARMLSSRFDPSCTVYSGNETTSTSQPTNGLSFGSSLSGNFASLQSQESADLDDAGRSLRPRRKSKHDRLTRKRRHFYEVFLRDVDAYWILDQRIQIFWPLDACWYFGYVTSYDPLRKLHHVKYDDREEEWIDLNKERFKLLLLPGEVPGKPNLEKSATIERGVAQEKRNVEVGHDHGVDDFIDSEPLIIWLARSTDRIKSSLLGLTKRRKLQPQPESTARASFQEDSTRTLPGCLIDGPCRAEGSNLCSDSFVPDKSENEEVSETMCSKDKNQPSVYIRKRFRQRSQKLDSTSINSVCQSIILYDPYIFHMGRFRKQKERPMTDQCYGVDDLQPGCVLWSGTNLGLLKLTVSPMKARDVMMKFCFQMQFADRLVGSEILWMSHTLWLLEHGKVIVKWPKVQLEMLFLDNVAGLRFMFFEGCLMQAVAFVFLVLVAFNQPNEDKELLVQKVPMTSIRFEISVSPSFRKRFIYTVYNFIEVKNSKWLYLDTKLKHQCSVMKQLPLSECTYDNIKNLQSRSSILSAPSECRQPFSQEGSRKRSSCHIMHKMIAKEPAHVHMSSTSSSCLQTVKRVPQFLLPFAAAPTFFLSLHLQLLMAKNVANINFGNPLLLLEGPENSSSSVADDGSLIEAVSNQVTPESNMTTESNMECTLSRAADMSGLLSSAESEMEVDAVSANEGDWATASQNHRNSNLNAVETSVSAQDSWTSVGGGHSPQEKNDTEFLSRLNGIRVEIPTTNQIESQSCDGEIQGMPQSTPDSIWSGNDCTFRSPNPTAPRSIWHRNRHNSGSLSFGYRSKVWSDGRVDSPPNGLVNGSRKPRSQTSHMLPFGNCDFNSKPRSHHRKGRPYKRLRIDGEKSVPTSTRAPQRHPEVLACKVNVLITIGDRGWRESGAHVVLECVDHNEWRLLVKLSGVTKYSYKAYQFLQSGTTNRYTHAMMWKGGKDWILEFPDRIQWTIFKEMHEECYNRNLRAASVKTIPIPGVRLIEEVDDNGVEVPFVRSSMYFMQVETDVDMALDPSRILYDMDSDDEEWMSKRRASSDASVSSLMEISEEVFERAMDMFEKVSYAQQHEDFTSNEIEELMDGIVPVDLIKDIYDYWKLKRRRKGMPLIRQLQPPLWEKYQRQLKEWELAINRVHYFPNGCKERSMLLEKPVMFAFCLRPRGLELPHKGSKQRSQRKISAASHNSSYSRDLDGHHTSGRRQNGFVYVDERYPSSSNHEFTSSWQMPTRVISPRDAVSAGYMSMSSDGSERSQPRKLHRNKLKKMRTYNESDSHMIPSPCNQRLVSPRNGGSNWNAGLPEWPSQNHHQREGYQRQKLDKQLVVPDLDEFRLRDASSAAQHASNMAKLKREKAQRLLYRADLAIHKATVALITAEAMKASFGDALEED